MKYTRNVVLTVALACMALFITGCGKSLSGTYADDGGAMKIEFKSGGKATVTILNQAKDGDYTIDGDKVTVKVNNDNQIFTIKDDGSLDGGQMFGMLKKK